MEGALTNVSNEGLLGSLLALAILAIIALFWQNQALHKIAREDAKARADTDRKDLERMLDAVHALRGATDVLSRRADR
jgi:hypothetical protein